MGSIRLILGTALMEGLRDGKQEQPAGTHDQPSLADRRGESFAPAPAPSNSCTSSAHAAPESIRGGASTTS
jgi:hypothetical protein